MDWHSSRITSFLERALAEDNAWADATTQLTVDPTQRGQGEILAKQDCVLAGLGLVARIFDIYLQQAARHRVAGSQYWTPVVVTSHPEIFDGVRLKPGQTMAVLRGSAAPLLSCERVTLNLLQRLSGIATLTRQYADAIKDLPVHLLDTRKTVPGLRALDKYAVTCGGGRNHRADLSEAILIKNNHIRLAGGVNEALARAQARRPPEQSIEIEVRTPAELRAALAAGADRVLLDNMTPEQVRAALEEIAGRVPVEISGGVRLANLRDFAETGAQFISVGALTHSAPAVDFSMRVIPI